MQQLLLDLLPPPLPTLDNFVCGSNIETLAALTDWLAAPTDTGFLLWGEPGSGRSHLLRAAGADYHDAVSDPALSALDPLTAGTEAAAFIAIDNVDRLDADGQIRLFHAFNRRRADGGRLLVAAPMPPRQLALREDLRTRLGLGRVYRLQPLSDDEKAQALMLRARERVLPLSAESIAYLIRRAPRDMGTLAALIDALDKLSREKQRPITLPLLRELLDNELPRPAT